MNTIRQIDLRQTIKNNVLLALTEDLGAGDYSAGDCTAALIPADTQLKTRVIAREAAVLAGQQWFDESFAQLDPAIEIQWRVGDGDNITPEQVLCQLSGPARGILSAERTGLNFLQTLSATATLAHQYVQAVAGSGVIILDTRKTIPGLRLAQKYAARCGGVQNHRVGLFDAILIKENHISAAGSINQAVSNARTLYPQLLLEVEVESLAELEEAAQVGAQRVLLDNFSLSMLSEAVGLWKGEIALEASGGVTMKTVRAIADTGVDYISIGEITKNIRAVDLSMRFLEG